MGESSFHGLLASLVAPAGVVGPDPRELHAVEVAEQRGRSVLQLADRSARSRQGLGAVGRRSAAPARRGRVVSAAGRRAPSGGEPRPRPRAQRCDAVLLGSAVQHHVWRNHRCRARPGGRSWTGSSFRATPAAAATSSASARASSQTFVVGRVRIEGLTEAFNLTNRRNVLSRNATFGSGSYPTNPVSSFNQVTERGRLAIGATGRARQVLSKPGTLPEGGRDWLLCRAMSSSAPQPAAAPAALYTPEQAAPTLGPPRRVGVSSAIVASRAARPRGRRAENGRGGGPVAGGDRRRPAWWSASCCGRGPCATSARSRARGHRRVRARSSPRARSASCAIRSTSATG